MSKTNCLYYPCNMPLGEYYRRMQLYHAPMCYLYDPSVDVDFVFFSFCLESLNCKFESTLMGIKRNFSNFCRYFSEERWVNRVCGAFQESRTRNNPCTIVFNQSIICCLQVFVTSPYSALWTGYRYLPYRNCELANQKPCLLS